MFKDMRKKSSSFIIYAMFAAIIITFVISFGPGDKGCRAKPNWAAIVNGDTITQSEYRFLFNNYYEFYQRIYPNFNATVAKQLKLSEKALDSLIDSTLLAQKAESMGYFVSEKEVAEHITNQQEFQTNGKFDRDLYNKVVQFQMASKISAYEEKVRLQLMAEKLRTYLEASVDISNKELQEEFIKANESVDAEFIVFSEKALKPEAQAKMFAAISADTVKDYMAKNEPKLKSAYDENKAKYVTEEQVQASHILIKVDEKTSDKEAKAKIEDINKEVKAGKDFAELAKTYSQCPSAPKGGDLGFFGKGRMVPEFDTAVFALKNKGDVSDIVKTNFGYHIIKLTDKKAKQERKFEEVKEELAREILSKDKIKALAEAEAAKAISLLKDGNYKFDDIKKDFADWNIEAKESKEIKKGSQYIPDIGIDANLSAKLFSIQTVPGYIPEVSKVEDKFVIAKVNAHTAADMNKFETEKDQLRKKLQSDKFRDVYTAYIQDIRKSAKIDYNRRFLDGFEDKEE